MARLTNDGGNTMVFMLVDDEAPALRDLEESLRAEAPEAELCGFTSPSMAMDFAKKTEPSIAFLDIEMGTTDGITMAKQLKALWPEIHIIFVTSYEQYALDAFSIHATGYLLKPVSREDIRRELTFIYRERKTSQRIQVKTFGGFDVYVDGKPLSFRRMKSKEFLAYLIDRRGSSVTLREAANILFEDGQYDLNRRKYMQTIYAELRSTLQNAGAETMLVKRHNSYAINTDTFDCDSYRFLAGDPIAINNYRRDYMICYSWAEYSMGRLEE
ncbi:MAG: response regulator [Clostridiales bacterium]|nr:response regulator [Clostridiales bacterium]